MRLQNYALSSGRRMWALVVFNEGPSAAGAGALSVRFASTGSQQCRVHQYAPDVQHLFLQLTLLT